MKIILIHREFLHEYVAFKFLSSTLLRYIVNMITFGFYPWSKFFLLSPLKYVDDILYYSNLHGI